MAGIPRANALPIFELSDRITPNGVPVSVTLRPILVAGHNVSLGRIMLAIGDTLRRRVIQIIRPYRPYWSDYVIRQRVRGILQMNNMGDDRSSSTYGITSFS